ncbi:ferric reductase-like transmembrane domain-containing protein [Gloeobacter morelensis]|uniref:Ferric reductase-like transmembrane domain-containing protein n=1 Tax=Gloeobacter morelensis MG652769 TaxID=2781736 RepID=A0ABY3PK35_9CYAN|nr:ferric reductase-like transmembrane domain-containing protein [Gloeobacter morelensis]UFP94037.1 ferric reductase-like transmembrane domain-containing protein [Gloeobacter morelensis MG652769]
MVRANTPWLTTLAVLVAAYIVAALLETVTLILFRGHLQGQRLGEYYGYASLACLGLVLSAPALGRQLLLSWRRGLGLSALGFAAAHTYLTFEHVLGGHWEALDFLGGEERLGAWLGVAALGLMLPLALTSTNGWIRRLGRQWRTLHRLIFPVAGLALAHAVWLGASGWPLKVLTLLAAAVVLLLRIRPRPKRLARKEHIDAS